MIIIYIHILLEIFLLLNKKKHKARDKGTISHSAFVSRIRASDVSIPGQMTYLTLQNTVSASLYKLIVSLKFEMVSNRSLNGKF